MFFKKPLNVCFKGFLLFIMKKINYILFIIVIANKLFGQTNLVPNYSFEAYDTCPGTTINSITYSPPWFSSTNSIANYFNSCTNGVWGVPSNWEGHQYARTGSAYAGIGTYAPGTYWRDYLQVKLISKLVLNKQYCVEFFVSLMDTQTVACNNIGLYLSDTAITGASGSVLNFIPQISNDNIVNPLTDKIGWTKVSGTFTANGAENYITIGNFFNDANSDTIFVDGGCCDASGYYIDDVSVQCCDCDTTQQIASNYEVPNAFSPNNDGHNDVFQLQGWKNVTKFTIIIYDRWGEKVFESNDPEIGWDGIYKGKLMEPGVYVYYISATVISGEKIIKKGNISLIR